MTRPLLKARVHVGGVGRIGSEVIVALKAAGLGSVSCNDHQRFEQEQLSTSLIGQSSDIGRPKVHVLERFLAGGGDFLIESLVLPNEAEQVQPYVKRADLVISCANSLPARLHLQRLATEFGKPCIQACVQDGRIAMGGMVSLWAPDAGAACFGCLLPNRPRFRRGEILYPTITRMIANLAAHAATLMLSGDPRDFIKQHNLLIFDLHQYALERFFVARRPSCADCDPHRVRRKQA